jgi:hypothetical protein
MTSRAGSWLGPGDASMSGTEQSHPPRHMCLPDGRSNLDLFVDVHYLRRMGKVRLWCALLVCAVALVGCNSQSSTGAAPSGKYDNDTCIALDSYVNSVPSGQAINTGQLYAIFGFGLEAERYALTTDAASLQHAVELKDTTAAEVALKRMSRTCDSMGIGPNPKP